MKKSRWCFQVPRGYWRKSWKITKMFSVLMCALTFSVSAAAFAQHERVTLNFRQATVRQVLNEIQRQTRLSFIYNTEQTEQLGQISVEAHNESVTSLLDRILTGTGLTWKIQEDLILISQAGPETTAIPQAQEQETVLLTGTVTDIQKMPLPGRSPEQVSELPPMLMANSGSVIPKTRHRLYWNFLLSACRQLL